MELNWAANWATLSKTWSDLKPPAIPSDDDLANFVCLAKTEHLVEGTVLVLGATPSLRVAMSHIPHVRRLYCIDANAAAYRPFPPGLVVISESFVHSNWLEMSQHLASGTADIIVGDKSIDNVPKNLWDSFFSECNLMLVKNGKLILHVGFPDKRIQLMPPEQLVREHFATVERGRSEADAHSVLWEDLLSHSAKFNDDFLSLENYRHMESSLNLHSQESEFFAAMARKHVSSWSDRWANFDEDFFVASAESNHFLVESRMLARDYPGSVNQPIFLLRKT